MDTSPQPANTGSVKRAGIVGSVAGAAALTASIFLLSSGAGATSPSLVAQPETEPAEPALIDDIAADDAAWAEFDECISAVFEVEGIDVEMAGSSAVMVDEFDLELDGDYDDEAFEIEFGPAVSVMDGDNLTFADFGEGDGSITITKSGDEIAVTSDGDVNVEDVDITEFEGGFEAELMDDGEFEDLFSSCDDKLPDGVDLQGDIALAEVVEN